MQIDFAPVNDVRCSLGEGPVWDERRQALFYCDIVERKLLCHDAATAKVRTWSFGSEVCSLGVAGSGRLVVALRDEVGLFDPDSGEFTSIAVIGRDNPETRLNDGKVGPDGAFWVGSMDERAHDPGRPLIGVLYRVDPTGKVEARVDGLKVSNGLAWSPDGRTMFHSDSRGPWIDRWDFDPATGEISNRTRIATLDDATGRPDGGATDIEGFYWSAGVSAGRLNRFAPDGKLAAFFPLPVGAPTMPCFGGPKLTTLFVTSLRHGRAPEMLERFPLTGTLVAGASPVAGAPVSRFKDT
jgi:sugar lactone lactonase YvrE